MRLKSTGLLVFTILIVVIGLVQSSRPRHHKKKPRILNIVQFYRDARHPKELPYPAAYVELKYPILRHPRKNIVPKVKHVHVHHHHSPAELDDEYYSAYPGRAGPDPHNYDKPSSVVSYTKTTTIEKGPSGVNTIHEYENPPVYEADADVHSYSPHTHTEDVHYHPETSDEGPTYVTYSDGEVVNTGDYTHSLSTAEKVANIGSFSSSPSSSDLYGPSHSSSSSSGALDLYNSSPANLAAPLIENIPAQPKHSSETEYGSSSHKVEIPIQPSEKVIKNVQLNEYIWVRREEGTPNVRLTLDPVKRSTYYLDDVLKGRRIHIVSRERVCIKGSPFDGTKASATECTADDPSIQWDFVSQSILGQYWIQMKGTNHCLQPGPSFTSPRLVELKTCDLYSPSQLWELGTVKNANAGWTR